MKKADVDFQAVRNLANDGVPAAGIAREIGCSKGSMLTWMQQEGIQVNEQKRRQHDARFNRALELHIVKGALESGQSMRELAAELDVGYQSVKDFASRHGLRGQHKLSASTAHAQNERRRELDKLAKEAGYVSWKQFTDDILTGKKQIPPVTTGHPA